MTTIKELRDGLDNSPEGRQRANTKAAGGIVIDDFDDALEGLLAKGLAVRVGDNIEITVKGAQFFEAEFLRRKGS